MKSRNRYLKTFKLKGIGNIDIFSTLLEAGAQVDHQVISDKNSNIFSKKPKTILNYKD
jgi:hypothetical protein